MSNPRASSSAEADGAAVPEQAQLPAGAEASAPQAEPPVDSKGEAALSPDAEVEQEISQAIQQLQSGKPTAGKPASSASSAAAAAKPRLGLLRRLVSMADTVFLPLALLVSVLDLPFRWLPGAVRQLLGYIAVGTALMTAALWYYIIISHPR